MIQYVFLMAGLATAFYLNRRARSKNPLLNLFVPLWIYHAAKYRKHYNKDLIYITLISYTGIVLIMIDSAQSLNVSGYIAYLSTNIAFSPIATFILTITDYSEDLKKALIKYHPIAQADALYIELTDKDEYTVTVIGGFFKVENIREFRPQIMTAANVQIPHIRKGKGENTFIIQTGRLRTRIEPGTTTEVSNVKFEELEATPKRIKKNWYSKTQPNPAYGQRFPIAISGNRTFYWDIRQTPHLGIFGPPGSGKSQMVNALIYSITKSCTHSEFHIIDYAKKGNQFNSIELEYDERPYKTRQQPNLNIIRTKEEFINFTKIIREIINQRQELLNKPQNREYSNIDQLPNHEKTGINRIFIIFDEILFTRLDSSQAIKNIYDDITKNLMISRAYNIHFILASQEGTKNTVGQSRDSLLPLVFNLQKNENEYILKEPFYTEYRRGVFATRDQTIGAIILGCAPYINERQLSKQLSHTAEQMTFANRISGFNHKVMLNEYMDYQDFQMIEEGRKQLI